MKIIDLTHLVNSEMPVFPGTKPPIFEPANTLETDGFIETRVTLYSHTGTHLDAPSHMIPGGLSLDKFGVESFIGQAVLVDLTKIASEIIGIDHLAPFKDLIEQADFLVLHTGWTQHWGTDNYFKDYPVISTEAAEWLLPFKLMGIGLDTISADHFQSTSFPVHHILFKRGLLVIENLTNLHLIKETSFLFSCLPLKTKDADGSPVRAVAIIG